jgi:hypothetical protein
VATIALRRASLGQDFEFARGFALGGGFLAPLAAFVGFAVEGLRDRCRSADFAELQDFDFELATFVADAKHVSDADFAGCLGELSVGENSPEFAGVLGQGARLEEARGPEPEIDAYTGHKLCSILLQDA